MRESVATASDRDQQFVKATIPPSDDKSLCSINMNKALNKLLGSEFASGLVIVDEEGPTLASSSVSGKDICCVSTTYIPTDDVSVCLIDTNKPLNELLGLDFGSGLIIAKEDNNDTTPSSSSPLPMILNFKIQQIALPPNALRHD